MGRDVVAAAARVLMSGSVLYSIGKYVPSAPRQTGGHVDGGRTDIPWVAKARPDRRAMSHTAISINQILGNGNGAAPLPGRQMNHHGRAERTSTAVLPLWLAFRLAENLLMATPPPSPAPGLAHDRATSRRLAPSPVILMGD